MSDTTTVAQRPRLLRHGPVDSRDLDDVLTGTAVVGSQPAKDMERKPERSWARELKFSLWRLRRQAMPHLVTGGVLLLGFLLHEINKYHGGRYAGSMAFLTFLLGLAGLVIAWLVRGRRLPALWRRRAVAAGLFTICWLTVAVVGFGPSALTVLLVGEFLVAARWWRRHRITARTIDKGPLPEPTLLPDTIVEDWKEYVGDPRGPLPGSRLADPEPIDHGTQYTVQFVRGSRGITDALGAMERICTGLNLKPTRLVFDNHPTGLPAQGLLKVMDRTPVDDNPPYLGPAWDDGAIRIGPYADWFGEATWRLWSPGETGDNDGSAWSGAIIGAPGSGKSRTVESIAIAAAASGVCVNWFIDPQGGSSSPALKEFADWYVDLTGADKMLRAVERVASWREFENATEGWTGFTPRPDRPLLVIYIDEAHEVLKGLWGRRLSKLARKVRKLGICFVIISQYPGIETFGGDEALRLSIMAGNGICFRTASNYAGSLMAGLEMDPKHLPKIAGYGYTIRTEDHSRLAPFRNRLCLDPMTWMERATKNGTLLEKGALSAAGPDYAKRAEVAESAAIASRAKLDAIREGLLDAGDAIGHDAVDDLTANADADNSGDFVLPTWPPAGAAVPHQQPGPESPSTEPAPDAAAGHAVVLEAIAAGSQSPGEIIKATGYSQSRVHQILPELVAAGKVVRAGHGRYTLPQPHEGETA
jgi:hypothetical protein